MEWPRGIGAVLRLGAEVLIAREGRAIIPRLGDEILIMIEKQLPIWPRL